MKIKLLFLSLLLLIPRLCFAALDADTIFEWRSTATADTLNGGGFNPTNATPGTDLSTYDSAAAIEAAFPSSGKFSGTDLVLADGDANPGVITSATHNFVDADEGNIIHITETGTGITVGWYEIVSTSGNAATLDRAAGTVDGQKTGGDWYLGGALNVKGAGTALEDDFFEAISGTSAADGITVYFYNNNSTSTVTFTPGETLNIAGTGGAQAPIKIIGYKTTRGDNPTGTSRPTIACGSSIWALGNNWNLYNLNITGTASPVQDAGSAQQTINCKVINSSTEADRNALSAGSDNFVFNSEFISYRGRALSLTSGIVIGNYCHNSKIGITTAVTSTAAIIINNIFESNTSTAISFNAAAIANQLIMGNIIYGSEQKTGTGINFITGITDVRILNNIIYGFVTGVSHADTQTVGYDDYNDYYNNTNDVSAAGQWQKGSNDQALNPTFTSVAQVTGTTATYAGAILTDAAASFANVVDSQDFVLIVSGTGLTTANVQYLITAHDATTITTSQDAGESSASDWVYQVTTGRNFAIGTNLKALGFPGAFQAGLTTGYMDIGAVQRQESAAGGGGGRGARFINN